MVWPQVYTFHMFQHQVDLADYELHVSFYRFGLAHHLAGQPLRFMMQVRAHSPLTVPSSDDTALIGSQPYAVLSMTFHCAACAVESAVPVSMMHRVVCCHSQNWGPRLF